MPYYRFHNFPVAAEAPLGATLALVNECLAKAGEANVPLRFCFHGSRGCAAIMARFPELRHFLSTAGPQSGGTPDEHLSNFGPSAPGALAGPAGEVTPETIAAVVEGIPREFPISGAHLLLGPISLRTTIVQSSRPHSPLLERMNTQCGNLSWQSSPTRQARRYFLNFIEPLPTADATQSVPNWIQALYLGFPGAAVERIFSDIEAITMQRRMVVIGPDRSFVECKSIPNNVMLPHQLPDTKASLQLKHSPLRGVRNRIAFALADDGWKQASGRKRAGVYELWKPSPRGRRLGLTFRIQNLGPLSRRIFGTLQLVSERGAMNLAILAERSTRREYEVPNPHVLNQVLDNMRVVVKHLENTWVAEIEKALGPVPPNYKYGDE